MTYPDVVVEFSPTTDPLDVPVWVEITEHLRSFSYSRGRSRAVNRAEAGTATIVLDNLGGRFDPGNTAGPYYPGVKPMRRIRITAVMDSGFDSFYVGDSFLGGDEVLGAGADLIPMFSGFVETWRQDWTPSPSPSPDATVTVAAVDAFKVFSLMPNLTAPFGVYDTGDLVNLLLDDIGWPADERDIEAGRFSAVAPEATRGESRLGVFQGIDATEGGLFFMGPDGYVVFTDADHIFRNPPAAGEVWGDVYGERDYGDVTISYDETVLWNSITVSAPGLADATAVDPLSQARYMVRDQSLSTLHADQTDMQTRAAEYISRFSEPRREITELEVGRRDDIDWKNLLTHDLQDRVMVRRRPLGEAMIEQDSVIEGISVDSPSRKRTNVKWRLSAIYGINLLTAQQSSLEEGNTNGWVVAANCTIAAAALPFGGESDHGLYHLALTAIAAGNMSVETTPTTQSSMAVVVGDTYTAMASFMADFGGASPGPRFGHVEIIWRDAAGAVLSSTVGASLLSGHAPYTHIYATGAAPASAAFATVRVVIENATTGSSGIQNVDSIGFVHSDSAAWSIGRGDLV